ncbi:acyl carrier protein [Nocardiopsis mangrovi]|uniref:Acyl carrier protein n=1 Tax=Nocardiopsis mangrovi TaxID=1179818 RepID=A0ABV9E2C2_9ACTN
MTAPWTGAATAPEIEAELARYLRVRTATDWAPDQDLFASGTLSSLFAMELVVHMEQAFGIMIGGTDLRMDNFRTIRSMTELAQRLRAETGGGDA